MVASNTRESLFDYSHRNFFYIGLVLLTINVIETTKIKKKRPEWPFKNIYDKESFLRFVLSSKLQECFH